MPETIFHKSPLGTLRISTDDSSITGILYANTEKKITVNEEEVVYKKAVSPVLIECVKQLDEYFSGERLEFSLHFYQAGTSFQQSVWAELVKINYGRTVSYLSLSKNLGNVKAIRAVGTANGKNSINIIVPCHRVIGSNGSLVGYGGDLWRKKWLLEHEGKFANGVQKLF